MKSLSLRGPHWMTDAHVKAFMPLVGKNLTCLEIIDCHKYHWGDPIEYNAPLSDASLFTMSKATSSSSSLLQNPILQMVVLSLEKVLRVNPDITTIYPLSSNFQLDTGTVGIISQYLPKLKELRNYWAKCNWLNDDTLTALVDAQEKASGDSKIALELIGLYNEDNLTITIAGIDYAVRKGLKEIEIDKNGPLSKEMLLNSNMEVIQSKPQYPSFIGRSKSDTAFLE